MFGNRPTLNVLATLLALGLACALAPITVTKLDDAVGLAGLNLREAVAKPLAARALVSCLH